MAQRVLFLHPSDEPYGADRILLTLAVELHRRGHEVCVLVADDAEEGWLSRTLTASGIRCARRPLAAARRSGFRPRRLPRYVVDLWRARRVVREEAAAFRSTVIHINTSALLVGALVGRPSGAVRVWHVHEIILRPLLMRWLFGMAVMGTAHRVVAVSDAVGLHLRKSWPARSHVATVHNGLGARPAPEAVADGHLIHPDGGLDRPEVVVAFVGRLNRWKGYEVFVDAAAIVAEVCPTVRFLIIGDPPVAEKWRQKDLQERLDAVGLHGRTTVMGFHPDPPKIMEEVDILVVPSVLPDPFPTVILEGMRASCAIVASKLGGAMEMIEEGQSGLFSTPGSAASVADAVIRLAGDERVRRRMGKAARRRVEREFTVAAFVDGIEGVYRDATAQVRRPRRPNARG